MNYVEKIPLKEKIFYGAGDICGGGSSTLMSVVLLVYLNKVLGIPTAIASSIILISKLWDAVSDPLMGLISDNTRTKFGRRKPFLILGGFLLLLAMIILFFPINSDSMTFKIIYSTVAYLFYSTASTIAQVPYSSLSSDISNDFKERNKANSFKLIFSMSSAAICYIIPSFLLESFLNGKINHLTFFLTISLGFGSLFFLTLLGAGIFTKERVQYNKDNKIKFNLKSYLEPFKIKSFNYHLIMYICIFTCMDILSALAVYYATDVMRNVTIFNQKMSSLYIIAPMTLATFLALPLTLKISKIKSKQFALGIGLPLYILGGLMLCFMPSSWPGEIIIISSFIMGLGLAGAQSMPWLIFPDVVDIAELKYGKRNTGSYSGTMTFLRKLSNAVAIWIVGITLTLSGEIPGSDSNLRPLQPDSVLLAIRLLLGLSILILMSITFIYSKKYKVTSSDLDKIKILNHEFLNKENLSTQEEKEKEDLINKLIK